MSPEKQDNDEAAKHDEDVKFERDKESAIVPLTDSQVKTEAVGETIIPLKEDTLGKSDFPPLTDLEKQAKLPEENR